MWTMLIALAAAVVSAEVTPDTPAITEAKANLARVKTPPALKSKPLSNHDAREDAERAWGHHGEVAVEGILGTDGRFVAPRIRRSSRSPGLDALALDTARVATFTPATDADGRPVAIWTAMAFEFLNRAGQEGGGLMQYRCDAFVEDTDWWRSAWPEREWTEYRFYKLLLGYETLGIIANRGSGTRAIEQIRTQATSFPTRGQGALAACRARSTAKLFEVMQAQR